MTLTRLKKVAWDLGQRWGRTGLTLAGLSVGLFGLCSVLVAFVLLADDLDENFRRTNPPHISVTVEHAIDDDLRAAIAAVPGVGEIEFRPAIFGSIETRPGAWMPLFLFLVEDFDRLRVARFFPQEGAWPPPTGGFIVERDSRFFLRADLGAELHLRFPGAAEITAPLSGYAYDPGQAPARMEMSVFGYVSGATLQAWGVTPPPPRMLITVPGNEASSAESPARRVAKAIEAVFEARGLPRPIVEIQDSPKHPHQFQLDAMVALLGSVAVVSFLLCAMLVINLIDSLMAGERRAIGVMRALGGRPRDIAGDYLLGVGMLGLIACVLSLTYAIAFGRLLARGVAMQLNFDLIGDGNPPWLAAVMLAVGFGVPILVALLRVGRATRMSIRDALARTDPTHGGFFTELVGRLFAPLPIVPRMAARAIADRPRRAVFTAVALALGLSFFIGALNIRTSLWETVASVERTRPIDLMLVLRGAHPEDVVRRWIGGVAGVKRSELWRGARVTLRQNGLQISNPSVVYAPPAKTWALCPDMIDGEWLDADRPNGVVVTQRLLNEQPLVRVGGVYQMRGAEGEAAVEVVGVMREFGPSAMYAAPAVIERLTNRKDGVNIAYVELDDDALPAQGRAREALEASAPGAGVDLATVNTSGRLRAIVAAHLDGIALVLLAIASATLLIGMLSLISSISVSVIERYREIGVLKAVGGAAPAIAALFVTEAMLIAVIGWSIALAVAPWLSRAISDIFGTVIIQYPFDYRPEVWAAPAALGVALGIAVVASLLPVRTALGVTISRALRS